MSRSLTGLFENLRPDSTCALSWQVEAAAGSHGGPDEDLSRHLEECEECRRVLRIVAGLRSLGDMTSELPDLPQSGFFWWKSQLEARRQRSRRMNLFLIWCELLSFALAAAVAVLGIGWMISFPQESLAAWMPAFIRHQTLAMTALIVLGVCLVGGFVAFINSKLTRH